MSQRCREPLSEATVQTQLVAGFGAVSPKPDDVFFLQLNRRVIRDLACFVEEQSFDLEHLGIVERDSLLLESSDVQYTDSIINVSKSVGAATMERFAAELGVEFLDSHVEYPELFEEDEEADDWGNDSNDAATLERFAAELGIEWFDTHVVYPELDALDRS